MTKGEWSDVDTLRALRWADMKISAAEIGRRLNRSAVAVANKLREVEDALKKSEKSE